MVLQICSHAVSIAKGSEPVETQLAKLADVGIAWGRRQSERAPTVIDVTFGGRTGKKNPE